MNLNEIAIEIETRLLAHMSITDAEFVLTTVINRVLCQKDSETIYTRAGGDLKPVSSVANHVEKETQVLAESLLSPCNYDYQYNWADVVRWCVRNVAANKRDQWLDTARVHFRERNYISLGMMIIGKESKWDKVK